MMHVKVTSENVQPQKQKQYESKYKRKKQGNSSMSYCSVQKPQVEAFSSPSAADCVILTKQNGAKLQQRFRNWVFKRPAWSQLIKNNSYEALDRELC